MSISSTFYVQIFRTNVGSAAFSSYVLTLAKKLYKKCAHIKLMKLTTDCVEALLQQGARPDLVDNIGRNALHWATFLGESVTPFR